MGDFRSLVVMQYKHPNLPGFISPAPFKLGEGDETISYARAWWDKATEQEIADLGFVEYRAPESLPPTPTPEAIDAERDRRIAAGFIFEEKLYQSRPEDRENMAGASVAALAAMVSGSEPGDYRWHSGDSDFVWIAEDNSLTLMDAQTMFALGQTAMAHKQAHIFAARALKDADPIPADYTDDAYWP
ncbi:DUF4376 domain-containing protein [Aquamicrobium zhengzhouense]|uniref:DUF4376 domain-containing protein n=1 Tax=Aquamicrobium zhengzhouense TaxID=2781738 RepID=A0ABS0SA60_9HYPH|nr:DUF4376 domain-containing protein [Aquamicrobium zhengzhouense]MBI1620164.1 DUF4376 domain-containing protein [Aquamicrobium zhengzhouense]